MKPALQSLMDDYQKYHLNHRNLSLHYLGIPFIAFGTIGLCSQIPIFPPYLDGGILLLFANAVFFISKDWKTSTPFILFMSLFYFASAIQPLWVLLSAFFFGWGSAIIGHKVYEKNEPAFFSNLWETLIGMGVMFMYVKLTGIYKPSRSSQNM